MNQLFAVSVFFGVFITLAAYEVGSAIKRRFKKSVFNPLLIAIILVILFLRLFDIEYSIYQEGAEVISFLLTPATICLAVPLYEQLELLKKNLKEQLKVLYMMYLLVVLQFLLNLCLYLN